MPDDGDLSRGGLALDSIAIVGASLAGLRAAETLRREGYAGRLTLIGAEPHLPYDRPPLSKQLLRGEMQPDQIGLRRDPYEDLEFDLRLGVRATGLDVANRKLALADGDLSFDGLLITTGATPRRLPPSVVDPGLEGVHVLRSLDDAVAIRDALAARPRVAVVGAGVIGMEVAASCRELGLEVAAVEPLRQPLLRCVGAHIGAFMADVHRDHGGDLRLGGGVDHIDGHGRVERVQLSDGSALEADLVIVGVGAAPETGWLEGSGLALDDGVVCDATCAAAPGIYAAGDVARWLDPRVGTHARFEHWTHAVEQAVAAAENLLLGPDAARDFSPIPLVWTDQYDLKVQVAGCVAADDEIRVIDGALEDRRFAAVAVRDGRFTGGIAVRRPRLAMQLRRALDEGADLEQALALGGG